MQHKLGVHLSIFPKTQATMALVHNTIPKVIMPAGIKPLQFTILVGKNQVFNMNIFCFCFKHFVLSKCIFINHAIKLHKKVKPPLEWWAKSVFSFCIFPNKIALNKRKSSISSSKPINFPEINSNFTFHCCKMQCHVCSH